MGNKFIFAGAGVLVLIIAAAAFLYFQASQIECSSTSDCLKKHYAKCAPYETAMQGSEAIIDFDSNVAYSIKILGKRTDACGLHFSFQSATSAKDQWAVGKTLTCYVTEAQLEGANPIDLLENYCEGDFAQAALARCKITGSSTIASTGAEKPVATCA